MATLTESGDLRPSRITGIFDLLAKTCSCKRGEGFRVILGRLISGILYLLVLRKLYLGGFYNLDISLSVKSGWAYIPGNL